jgi:hypothetical protein
LRANRAQARSYIMQRQKKAPLARGFSLVAKRLEGWT